jgi:hypothetical protein
MCALLVLASVSSARYRRFRRYQLATPQSFDGAFCRQSRFLHATGRNVAVLGV